MNFYTEASNTFDATNQDKRTILALQNVVGLKDEISLQYSQLDSTELQSKYKADDQLQKNKMLKEVNTKLETQQTATSGKYYGLLALFLVVAIGGIFLWFRFSKKSKIKDENLSKITVEKQLNETELKTEREISQEKEQRLQRQNQELMSNSLSQVNLKEQLQTIVTELKADNQFENASKLERLDNQLHWKLFMEKFDAVNPNFIGSLSKAFPQLSQSELQFCALVKLNLSYKEIGNILQITHQSVFTKKYRLKKKIQRDDDADFLKLIHSI